jgi:predicted RecB family nuclease
MFTKITRAVLDGYLECAYKGRLRLAGELGNPSDHRRMTSELEVHARSLAYTRLVASCPQGEASRGARLTLADLGLGQRLVLDVIFEDEELSLQFDGLMRVEGVSRLGSFHYAPVLCQPGATIRRQTRELLAVMGLVLEVVQDKRPATALVIRGSDCRRTKVALTSKLYRRAGETLVKLKRMRMGQNDPVLTLNDHCPECEFRNRCRDEAMAKNDLSLLRVMTDAELQRHRSKGIFTVTQLSYTFRPRRKGKRVKGRELPHYAALQALAIRDRKTYVLAKPEVPDRPLRVYFDLEGGANGTGVYLAGALVLKDSVATMHSFWADHSADEERLLRGLLDLVDAQDFVLFHFGSYERSFLKRMRRQARKKGPVDRLLDNAVDVLSLIRSNVYFPVYANGLKEIGGHLGFSWTHPDAGGLQSLVWRQRWEQTSDDSVKQQLISYNAEDCAALRLVVQHLVVIGGHFTREGDRAPASNSGPIERVQAGKRGDDFNKWGHTTFLLPEFERASRCAWFDYQREKIVVRKSGRKRRTQCARRTKTSQPRPTKQVLVRSNRCPGCKSRSICTAKSPRQTKLALDLKVSVGGVRRIVVRYTAAKYRCENCGRYFLPRKFKKLPHFGHALKCWVIYQHVANRCSFETLERIIRECFGLMIGFSDLYRFKIQLARRYKRAYISILKKILSGNLLHADETGIRFKYERGYVWALTNLKSVAFMCEPSRETDFLVNLLKDFSGVLVTDFYKGYDSMPCPQQKCLVHLIRDLNGDLQANFHDEDFKYLCKAFGSLLTKVIETVDRHGLQRERLQRHKANVEEFYQQVCTQPYQSEVTERYRQRFLKYQDKLFTFLDHDGVPWHNNNAEHAIKHFAKYRMVTNGRVTANGLQSYLVLLSLYQTCVYRKINFLRFLLSEQPDVDSFCVASARRRGPVRVAGSDAGLEAVPPP